MHEEQCPIPPSSRKTANGHLGGGGGGVFEQWPFLWKKWDFCSEVKKITNVEIKCRRQFLYRLCQHLESLINILITNVNVNIKI